VTVRGSLQDMTAVGNLTVIRARIVPDDLPASGPRAVRPWELTVAGVYGPGPEAVAPVNGREPPPPGADAPLPFLRADLSVEIPRNAWIQGPGTAVEVSGSVHIDKELGAPFVISGSIETMRGFASFYGKKFALEDGRVTFTGSPELNPLLDVTVTKEVADYLITMHVGGRAQKPELTLSSTPELPQADIVSLLLIGKTTDRLTSSERTTLASQAQQLASNLVAGQLENIVGERLGLDMIEITAGDTLGEGSVRVGRYVTQDLFMSYEREFGAENGGIPSASNTVLAAA
jgi:autotransporter translocation and assembly factor TamB